MPDFVLSEDIKRDKYRAAQSLIAKKMSIVYVTVLVLLVGVVKSEYNTFTWKSCTKDKAHQALRVDSVDVHPMPVLTPGPMIMSFSAEVLKEIQTVVLDFNVEKNTLLGVNTHVPCINGLGSCILDGCSIVDDLVNGTRAAQRDLGRQIKKMFESVGIFTSCPIQVQNVTVQNFQFHLPELGPAVNFIADGDYTVTVTAKHPSSGVEYGCFQFNATLKRKKQSGFLLGRRKRNSSK